MPTASDIDFEHTHSALPVEAKAAAQPLTAAIGIASHGRRATPLDGLRRRLAGPGGVYTLGNVLGLTAGSIVAGCHGSSHSLAAASLVVGYLFGSPSASLTTLATLIFFASGEAYHRARSGSPGSARALAAGDLFSGCGALALGGGLFLLGDPLLALTSGMLHAGGKFGSAIRHWTRPGGAFACDVTFRSVVLCSRLPAITLAAVALLQLHNASIIDLSLPATILVCTAIWAIADAMLLRYAFVRAIT